LGQRSRSAASRSRGLARRSDDSDERDRPGGSNEEAVTPFPRGIEKRRDPLTGGEWLEASNDLGMSDEFRDSETGKVYRKINGVR
jgi:hypothetical protein